MVVQSIEIPLSASLNRSIRQLKIYQLALIDLGSVRSANRKFRDECGRFSHVGHFKLVLELLSVRKIGLGEFSHIVANGFVPSSSEFCSGGNEFSNQPCPLAINEGIDLLRHDDGLFFDGSQCQQCGDYRAQANNYKPPIGPFEGCAPAWRVAVGILGCVYRFISIYRSNRRKTNAICRLLFSVIGTSVWLAVHIDCGDTKNNEYRDCRNMSPCHGRVAQPFSQRV
jgi:hypothetical protein